jgi:hypothetical protein
LAKGSPEDRHNFLNLKEAIKNKIITKIDEDAQNFDSLRRGHVKKNIRITKA